MQVDPTRTRSINHHHSFEVGQSSWDPNETSIRCRYDDPATGRFSPHGSSELPLHDLQPLIEVAAQHDLLSTAECAAIIEALAASIRRADPEPNPNPTTGTTMTEEPNEDQTGEPEWPREITIRATVETAKRSLGEDYDEDHEGDDALLNEIGQSMETIEISSWEELEVPDGYEIADDDDREEYEVWRDSNRTA